MMQDLLSSALPCIPHTRPGFQLLHGMMLRGSQQQVLHDSGNEWVLPARTVKLHDVGMLQG